MAAGPARRAHGREKMNYGAAPTSRRYREGRSARSSRVASCEAAVDVAVDMRIGSVVSVRAMTTKGSPANGERLENGRRRPSGSA